MTNLITDPDLRLFSTLFSKKPIDIDPLAEINFNEYDYDKMKSFKSEQTNEFDRIISQKERPDPLSYRNYFFMLFFN